MRTILPPVVGELISVERLREQRSADEPKLVAPMLGLLNLFFLAYFERYLTGERSTETLALLIFLEITLFVILAITRFLSVTEETLRRAALFPTTPWDRFVFSGISNLRRPVTLLWWGSVVLAFLILAHGSWTEVFLPSLHFTLLVLCAQMMITLLLLTAGKAGGNGFAIVWTLLACASGIAIVSLLFGERSLLRVLLPVQWVAEAIHATGEGNLRPSFHAFALLFGIGGGSLILARRIC
jgi:hypothetical protein